MTATRFKTWALVAIAVSGWMSFVTAIRSQQQDDQLVQRLLSSQAYLRIEVQNLRKATGSPRSNASTNPDTIRANAWTTVGEAGQRVVELQREADELEQAITSRRQELAGARDSDAARQQAVETQVTEAGQRVVELQREADELEQAITSRRQELAGARAARQQAVETQVTEAGERVVELQREADELEQAITSRRQELAGARDSDAARQQAVETQVTEAGQRVVELQREADELEQAIAAERKAALVRELQCAAALARKLAVAGDELGSVRQNEAATATSSRSLWASLSTLPLVQGRPTNGVEADLITPPAAPEILAARAPQEAAPARVVQSSWVDPTGAPSLPGASPPAAVAPAPPTAMAPPAPIGQSPAPAPPLVTVQAQPAVPPLPPNIERRLIDRAEALLKDLDISGARLVLERALETGSSRAVFFLAQTYDPKMLAQWHVRGAVADAAKARDLYGRALAAGIAEVGARTAEMRAETR